MGELLCKCAVVATECEQGMCRSACVELVKLKAAVVRYSSALALKGQTARSEKLGSVTKEHFFSLQHDTFPDRQQFSPPQKNMQWTFAKETKFCSFVLLAPLLNVSCIVVPVLCVLSLSLTLVERAEEAAPANWLLENKYVYSPSTIARALQFSELILV